jgi:lipid II:glycine glycyltransferase (peptidoglycan interpeptide bridge formation enzyme)
LHWQEILEFKRLGFEFYDLGGLPMDDSDPVKNAIAKFKLEFGGEHVIEYNGLIPRNIVARAALAVRRRFV